MIQFKPMALSMIKDGLMAEIRRLAESDPGGIDTFKPDEIADNVTRDIRVKQLLKLVSVSREEILAILNDCKAQVIEEYHLQPAVTPAVTIGVTSEKTDIQPAAAVNNSNRLITFILTAGICLLSGNVVFMIVRPKTQLGVIIIAASVTLMYILINRPINFLVNKLQGKIDKEKTQK